MLIDTHCHINAITNISLELKEAFNNESFLFLDSSIDLETSLKSLELAKDYSRVYSALGFHPISADKFNSKIVEEYEKLIINNRKVIAIGEIGLDGKTQHPLDLQEEIFRSFIQLAKKISLPIIIHNRLDEIRVTAILDEYFSDYSKVIFHCFSYSKDLLKRIIDKGGFVSFSLNLLRQKDIIMESLKLAPVENMLLETDSPYIRIRALAPIPLDIKEVYEFVAKVKGLKKQELEDIIGSNAKKLFFYE